jgi:hypothetical protein
MEDTKPANLTTEAAQADLQPEPKKPTVFVPTEEELFQLVKYWTREATREEWGRFNGLSYGHKDLYWTHEKWRRVHEIAEVLRDELTNYAIDEALAEEAQECDRNTWIVFRYGTTDERREYEATRRSEFQFEPVAASAVASKVVERIFREASSEEQADLLNEELQRYATKFEGYIAVESSQYRRCFDEDGYDDPICKKIDRFGIRFPATLKSLVPEISDRFEEGKAMLKALDEIAKKGEDALKTLIAGDQSLRGPKLVATSPGRQTR